MQPLFGDNPQVCLSFLLLVVWCGVFPVHFQDTWQLNTLMYFFWIVVMMFAFL